MPGLNEKQNAIEILRTEHEQMREMLRILAATDEPELIRQLLHELNCVGKVHAELEVKFFYPFVSKHVRFEHMKRTAQEFQAVEKLLSELENADQSELRNLLVRVGERLEKHIFDAEELLFMRIEQRCSDVTYSLSQLSAKMISKRKELHRKLGLDKQAS
ncbi:MAG TPA: hemerythrin domain-containing protein [Drouetiella sp.]|jgi:hemerythrin-like domain-containing protein